MKAGTVGGKASPFRVAVVGGGISGLSTAWHVEKRAAALGLSLRCSVYESGDRWGGRILTDIVERDDFGRDVALLQRNTQIGADVPTPNQSNAHIRHG